MKEYDKICRHCRNWFSFGNTEEEKNGTGWQRCVRLDYHDPDLLEKQIKELRENPPKLAKNWRQTNNPTGGRERSLTFLREIEKAAGVKILP